jgi:putative transposase
LCTFEKAVLNYGLPDIINSDQGCQFTGTLWTETLKNSGILISMSGRGRSNDNAYIERLWRTLKYEWTIIKGAK